MEQKFGKNSIDIEALREFCEREGKEVTYRKGDQMERKGDPECTAEPHSIVHNHDKTSMLLRHYFFID